MVENDCHQNILYSIFSICCTNLSFHQVLKARIIIDIWCFNLSHHLQASSSYHLHPICVNGFCTTTISLFLSCLKNCNNKQTFSFLEKIEIEMHIIKHMYLDYVHHRLLSIPNNSSDHHHLSLARPLINKYFLDNVSGCYESIYQQYNQNISELIPYSYMTYYYNGF
jgi:hypothetical protein